MIRFELLTKENMNEYSLDYYERTQKVQRVYRKINNEYLLIDSEWIMDWSLDRKRAIAKSLFSDEYLSYGVFDDGNMIGFTSIQKRIQEERIVLEMLHVSQKYRGQGIGRKLFQQAKDKAKELGAKQLYISAFSSEDTIQFYKSVGCNITNNPIKKIAEEEPFDIQMSCDIY